MIAKPPPPAADRHLSEFVYLVATPVADRCRCYPLEQVRQEIETLTNDEARQRQELDSFLMNLNVE